MEKTGKSVPFVAENVMSYDRNDFCQTPVLL